MKPDRSKDRPALLALADILDTRPALIRRDECSDWNLFGTNGHIYAIPEHDAFYVYLGFESARAWTNAKRRLAFCRVTQNGGDEGFLRMSGFPNKKQAEALRRTVGLPKRRHLSPEHKAKLVATQFKPKLVPV